MYRSLADDALICSAGNNIPQTTSRAEPNDGDGDARIVNIFGDDRDLSNGSEEAVVGDSGSDTFIFKDNFGVDTIVDFEDGVDILSFIGNSQIDELSDLSLSQQGSDTLISDGANEVILIEILVTTIDASDFIFM